MPCKIKQSDLAGFTGTSHHYQHWAGNLLCTDGTQFLNENGAGWLIDAIASYQGTAKLQGLDMQFWHLEVRFDEVRKSKSAVLTCRKDSGLPALVTQEIEFTDFPFSIDIWVQNGTVILPSEY